MTLVMKVIYARKDVTSQQNTIAPLLPSAGEGIKICPALLLILLIISVKFQENLTNAVEVVHVTRVPRADNPAIKHFFLCHILLLDMLTIFVNCRDPNNPTTVEVSLCQKNGQTDGLT